MATSCTDPCLKDAVKAFVQMYYMVLRIDPGIIYKESSILSRLDPNGNRTTALTIQDICNLIRSLELEHCKIKIKAAAANMNGAGLTMLVTGIFTEKDGQRCLFTQSLLLDPPETGLAVHDDIFWCTKECGPDERKEKLPAVDDTEASLTQTLGSESTSEKTSTDSASRAPEKLSEASTSTASINASVAGSEGAQNEGKGYPIHLSIFPPPVASDELETELLKFGPLKRVKAFHDSMHGTFGSAWIEFQDAMSVVRALRASPIRIGDKKALVGIARIWN